MASLVTGVEHVRGIGPRRAEALAERGIVTVEDLLHHLPVRYEDRGRLTRLSDIREGETVTARGLVRQSALRRTRRRGFTIVTVVVDDGTDSVRVVFFNRPYLKERLVPGVEAVFHGPVQRDPVSRGIQIQNPDFEILPEGGEPAAPEGPRPVYGRLPGLTQRGLRIAVGRLLDELPDELPATLPPGVARRRGLPSRKDALLEVHGPPPGADAGELQRRATAGHQRLIYEELFAMQLAFRLRRRELGLRPDHRRYRTSPEVGDRLRELLPFRLTPGQRRAFKEIVDDLSRPVPMSRLLQGDVGAGKTIVALLAMLLAAESGFQAALMAPTELLAEQHARVFGALLGGRREIALLTGSARGRAKRTLQAAIASGGVQLVIGTQALIQEAVTFADLALVVVDEQHRFGVSQRALLAAKGTTPDALIMTATPIPRTLSLTLHGDLDVSVIPDRPPGRRGVRTVVRDERSRGRILRFLRDELAHGRRAYIVHPVIDESEEADLRAATEGAERLRRALPGRRVGLVHGRIPAEERDAVMRAFARGDVDLLVATTVIEVGIDVPEATVMIVENAERFGLAQLHQLRGRVGRGAEASWCILLRGRRPTPEGRRRLELLETTDDGFQLAEADLRMRGAGEFFGSRQVGLRDLRIADPVRDRELLEAAREDAIAHVDSLDDDAFEDDPLVRAVRRTWLPAVERSAVG